LLLKVLVKWRGDIEKLELSFVAFGKVLHSYRLIFLGISTQDGRQPVLAM
jgi:hypothetical protein